MIQSRYYQDEAEQSIYDYFAHKQGNPVVALPTGTGKSVVIAKFIYNALQRWPKSRFIMLTHVKKLIEQNAAKLRQIWPNAPLGIYSAGLKERSVHAPIIFGGIHSVASCVGLFGYRDVIIIDECHLVSVNDSAMYQKVIAKFKAINPHVKVIGLSATPYRMGQGLLTDGGIFTDICYNLTDMKSFNRLIEEGYLAPLIPKRTNTQLNVEHVKITKGEYDQHELQLAVNQDKITYAALVELLEHSQDRICGLIFATGIEHAESIKSMLSGYFGQSAVAIHSGNTEEQNEQYFTAWAQGKSKWAVSMNSLTTGVDVPMIDVIGVLRPTKSTVLWVQLLGRGTRPSPQTQKQNCLVMDFAANTAKLGPINDPIIPRKKGAGTGDAPIRICDACGCYNHASARTCINCGEVFEIRTKFKDSAGTDELIRSELPVIEYYDVTYVIYAKHEKAGSPDMIKVSYFCGMQKFDEWVCFDHTGFPRKTALDWLRQRMPIAPEYEDSATTENVLKAVSMLRAPKRIRVHVNLKYPKVLGYEY